MLRENLRDTSEGWAIYEGQQTVDEEQRFWQFRISVKPTPTNLSKARKALEKFIEENSDQGSLPTIKILQAKETHYWDATETAPKGLAVSDRDQLGKEICVYMDYDSAKKKYAFTPEEYKHFMLSMWKALEDEGVELSYSIPPGDEYEVTTEPGILTPFMYSSFKPYRYPEVRHGIMLSDIANPKKFPDPLQKVVITQQDLAHYKIRDTNSVTISKKRIEYQNARIKKAITSLRKEVAEILSPNSLNNSKFAEFQKQLRELLAINDDKNFMLAARTFFDQLMIYENDLPSLSDSGFSPIVSKNEIKYYLDKGDSEKLREYLEKIPSSISNELDMIKSDLKNKKIVQFCKEHGIKYDEILKAVDITPIKVQFLFRRIYHTQNAIEQLYVQEANLKVEEDRKFKQVVENITETKTSSSLTSDYVSGIKKYSQLDELIRVLQLLPEKKSVFSSSATSKQIDLILNQLNKLIQNDSNYPLRESNYQLIHHAANLGLQNVVRELLKRGENINNNNSEYGRTPLLMAVFQGRLEMVKFLVNAGADLNQAAKYDDQYGRIEYPLFLAVEKAMLNLENQNNLEVYSDIIKHLVSTNRKSNDAIKKVGEFLIDNVSKLASKEELEKFKKFIYMPLATSLSSDQKEMIFPTQNRYLDRRMGKLS